MKRKCKICSKSESILSFSYENIITEVANMRPVKYVRRDERFLSLEQWFSTFFKKGPILQPNVTYRPPSQRFLVRHMQCNCLHNRYSKCLKIAYDITVEQRIIKFMHMLASVSDTHAVCNHSTKQLIKK